jgi:cell division protein FtsB
MKQWFRYIMQRVSWEQLPTFLRNKYTLTVLVFLVWMTFFDQNNIISQIKLQMKLDNLQEQKTFYTRKIEEIKASKQELLQNSDKLERFAREKYWMKRPDEDLYIIKTEK